MVRFFKKFDTRVPVNTGAGFRIPFEQVFDDEGRLLEWGVLQTSDGYVISELEGLIRRQAGGVMEVSREEYDALKKKEQQTLSPTWRETLWPRQRVRMLLDAARASAAGVKTKILPEVVRSMRTEMQSLSRPMGTVSDWRPKTVAR